MDSLNWVAIIGLTVMGFILGPIWYGPLFGKTWMRIHGADKKSKEEMKKSMEGMWKLMISEFIATLLMTIGLAWMIPAIAMNTAGALSVALWVWGFFVLPMSVSNVIWGGDKKEFMVKKIALIVSFRLLVMIIAGYVLINF